MRKSAFLRLSTLVKPGDSYSSLSAKHLDLSTTQDEFNQGKQAYADQNFDLAIQHFTRALDNLQNDILSVILLHRAATYESQKKYDLAADDGKRANPCNMLTRPDPYLVLGNVRLLQSKLDESEAAYRKGADIVDEKEYPKQREELVNKSEQVMAIAQKRNQWMVQLLPYEVLSNILSQLSVFERVALAKTCRFWHNFMMNWPKMWHTVDLACDQHRLLHKSYKIYNHISDIPGNQVKEVVTSRKFALSSSMSKVQTRFLDAILAHDWNRIESLEMGGFPREKLDSLMILNRRSLTRLTLHSMWDNDNEYVEDYAHKAACKLPNLRFVSQYIHQGNDIGIPYIRHTLPSNLPSGLHLTKLDLSWTKFIREPESIQQLVRKSHHLISLTLNGLTYPYYATMLETVNEHCPVLQEFCYTSSLEKVAITEYTSPPSTSVTNNDLKKLVIRPPITSKNIFYHRTHAIDEQLKLILRRSHSTLETLDLDFGLLDPTGGYTPLNTLANMGAPNLQCLVIDASLCYPGIRSQQISEMISACPSLQVVDITGNYFWHKCIFDTLANKTTELRKLSINVNDTSPPQQQYPDAGEDTVLPTAFSLATVFKKAHHLCEFSFGQLLDHGLESTLAVDIASHLCRSRSIRQVDFRKVTIKSSRTLLSILEQLARAPIHKVCLHVDFELSKEEFKALAAIKTLKRLELETCQESLCESTIYSLFEEWQSQASLFVRIERIDSFAIWEGFNSDNTITVKCVREG